MREGNYFEPFRVSIKGTADKPITIRSYPGELAIVDAGLRDFFDDPENAWLPAKDGRPDEFISAKAYPGLEKVFGNFGDSMVPLHGYKNLADLRSDNEYWNGGGKLDTNWSIYCGPGVWYDQGAGRVHCRLAHTKLPVLGPDNYRGITDPRRIPLVVTAAPNAMHIRLAEHIRVYDLVFRGARKSALNIEHSTNIEVDNVTCFGSDPAVNLQSCHNLKILNSNIRGIASPWSFRSGHKYRGTAAYLLVARGDDSPNREVEIANCELTDSHDGPFVGTIRGLKFHHNLVDNFNDDGVYLTAMTLGGDVDIFQNRISRCLHAFAFFGEYPVGKGVAIYRNVIDLRAPVHYFQPRDANDERFVKGLPGQRFRFPSAGGLCGDHGGPIWEPIHFYQNTVVARDASFRNYYGMGWGGHMKGTERAVRNNIFVQLEGWPGVNGIGASDELQTNTNLHFGLKGERPKLSSKVTVPADDLFKAPRLIGLNNSDSFSSWQKFANVELAKESPAIDAGGSLPKDWNDPLRAEDGRDADIGALPKGVRMSAVGPTR